LIFIKLGILECELLGNITPSLKYLLRENLKYEDQKQLIARASAKKRLGYIPKQLSWSGVTYLIDEKNRFPSGLLTRVLELITAQNQTYQFTNELDIPFATPLSLTKPLNLWSHQKDAVEAIKREKTGIIQIAPGGGKTKLSVVATAEIGQFPMLFVVNRVSLLNQTHDDYANYFNESIGYLGNGRVEPQSKINIATIGTLCSMLKIKYKKDDSDGEKLNYTKEQITLAKNLMAQCKFVIFDECHHGSSSTYKTLMKALPKAFYRIGLSGTPFRTAESENILLEAALGQIIYKKTASELIRDGILVKPKIYFIKYKDSLSKEFPQFNSEKPAFTKVYKECIVENELFNDIVSKTAVANASANKLTLVSVKQINHGQNIYDAIKKISPDLNIEFLNGQNKKKLDEEKIKQDFSDGKIKVLVSTLKASIYQK
jgi:superfamily II DNA or RNA helicase